VRAIKRLETSRQPTLGVAGKNALNLRPRRRPQVVQSKLVDDELGQELDRARDRRSRQPHVLVSAIIGFAVSEDAEHGHQLLEWMRLRLPRRIHALRPKRAPLDRPVDPQEDRHGNAKTQLTLHPTENRGKTVEAKVIS